MKAEEPLSEDREEHQPAGQNCLHGREWGECERLDVQAPGQQRKDPANGEPPLAKQICRAAQRMTCPDWSGEHCTASLEQGTQIGTQRTDQCKARPRSIANPAARLSDARCSIEYGLASATHDHESVFLIARSLVAALGAAVS